MQGGNWQKRQAARFAVIAADFDVFEKKRRRDDGAGDAVFDGTERVERRASKTC